MIGQFAIYKTLHLVIEIVKDLRFMISWNITLVIDIGLR
jgi:hypothetical protein